MYQGNAFVRIAWLLDRHPSPAPSLVVGQQDMMAKVDAWRMAYLELWEGLEDAMIAKATQTYSYLLMYHCVLKVWVATCISPFQTAFDAYFAVFEEILIHAEAILSANAVEVIPPFTAEMGVVPPLYFVAIKCRHPDLRRKALSLLEITKPKGIWRLFPAIAIVRKVIELEEVDMMTYEGDRISDKTDSHHWRLPEEANRIHHLAIASYDSARSLGQAALRVMRVDWDVKGQRQMRDDVVALESENPVKLRRTSTRPLTRLPVSTPYLDNKYL